MRLNTFGWRSSLSRPILSGGFSREGSGCIAEGVQPSQARTEWRGNAVAVPLFAVRAAAQGDVILRGSGELKCRVTKGRTVQRQAARNRHTVNAKLLPVSDDIYHSIVQFPTRQVTPLR